VGSRVGLDGFGEEINLMFLLALKGARAPPSLSLSLSLSYFRLNLYNFCYCSKV